MIAEGVKTYRKGCEGVNQALAVAGYRGLYRYFRDGASQASLCDEYLAWTGHLIEMAPPTPVLIQGPRLMPWTVVLVAEPSGEKDLPSHAVQLPVVEAAFLRLAPESIRGALYAEMAKQWERTHLPQPIRSVLQWFQETDWEVVRIGPVASGDGPCLYENPTSVDRSGSDSPKGLKRPVDPSVDAVDLPDIGSSTTSPGPAKPASRPRRGRSKS